MAVWCLAAVFALDLLLCFFFPPPHCVHALLMGLCLARRTNTLAEQSDTKTDGSERIDSYLSLEAHTGCTIPHTWRAHIHPVWMASSDALISGRIHKTKI